MIVLWNTLYMNAVLDQLRAEGYDVRPEDEARLSPFGHEHTNMFGKVLFRRPRCRSTGRTATTPNPKRILNSPTAKPILKSVHGSIAPKTHNLHDLRNQPSAFPEEHPSC
jgi:hypothetical protein